MASSVRQGEYVQRLNEIRGRHHVVLIHKKGESETPVLWLFIDGQPQIFRPLLDYLQDRRTRKLNWQRRAARSVGLFFDFSRSFAFDENSSLRNRHSATLSAFIHALQQGTIPSKGVDKTGLFWAPMSSTMVYDTVRHLDYFVDYTGNLLQDMRADHPLNALKKSFDGVPSGSTTLIRFLITAKMLSSRSFLKHLKEEVAAPSVRGRSVGSVLGIEKMAVGYRTVKAMPLELISDLLSFGFIKNPNATNLFDKEDLTAKMIFILLVGGGLRSSEPLHMWFNDVTTPTLKGQIRCIPVLRHPSEAPTYIVGENSSRIQYLRERGLLPRNLSSGKSMYVGWKDLAIDERTKSTEVLFFHENLEHLFYQYYSYYLNYRRHLIAMRKARGDREHPFLFISNGEDRDSGKSYIGSPYSQGAFRSALTRALNRVEKMNGQTIPRGKNFGTTPHALRHAYAMVLIRSGAPQKAIQRALHHRSILSQDVYTQPEWEDVNTALNSARTGNTLRSFEVGPLIIDPHDETRELAEKWHF